jgi:hypothetical protein
MNKELEKLLENTTKEAHELLLKEYTLKQKAKLGALIKFLAGAGVEQNDLKALIEFYRYDSNIDIEDNLIYNEFKNKLIQLAEKSNIEIPEEMK